MDILRWILLIFGVILLAAIYFSGRRKEWNLSRKETLSTDPKFEIPMHPHQVAKENTVEADIESDPIFDFERLLSGNGSSGYKPESSAVGNSMLLEDEFVVIHLQPLGGLSGPELYSMLGETGFELGSDRIFHYQQPECRLLVVNMFKPGVFPSNPDSLEAKGISLILSLARLPRPMEAFGDMLSIAHELKSSLNMQLFDVRRRPLTRQTIALLEEEIREYQLRQTT